MLKSIEKRGVISTIPKERNQPHKLKATTRVIYYGWPSASLSKVYIYYIVMIMNKFII